MCHSHGLKFIRPSNVLHSTHIEEEAHKECGLQCSKRAFSIFLFQLPKPLCFSKKFIPKVSWIPVLSSIRKAVITVLGQDSIVSV